MKSLSIAAGIVGALGVVINCGGGDGRAPAITDGGSNSRAGTTGVGGKGQGGSNNKAGSSNVGGAGGDANGDLALKVEITSPAPASDPVKDEVLVTDDVKVTCIAKANAMGDVVNASTVSIAVVDEDETVLRGNDDMPLEFPAMPTGAADEYSAEVPLGALPSGPVSFKCSAAGTKPSVVGEATVTTLLDHGPTVVPKLPVVDSAHRLDQVLEVAFTVTPTRLGASDKEADVASVTLMVAGVEIKKLTEDAENPGSYHATVDFNDPFLFDEPPTEHTSVRIEATNKRTATAAKAIADYPFVVDGKPPVISIKKPALNAAVKGETVVEFSATDSGAGVDQDTIEVILNSSPTPIKYDPTDQGRWSRVGDTYSFRFDTAEVGTASAQITVDINATDDAGNSVNGDSLFLWLDNVPPIVDLDPGNWRIFTKTNGKCSGSFDPLGKALSDTDVFNAFARVRALVYDVTKNTGQKVDYPALADQKSAKLYVQVDTTQPFLIDMNDDGTCDALARDDFPYKALAAVKPAGTPLFSEDRAVPPAAPQECTVEVQVQPEPQRLCTGASDMYAVVQHDVRGVEEPVVYATGVAVGLECTGNEWDPIAITPQADGWICYAARADDTLGNTGYSRPLRVCYDNPNIPGAPACASGNTIPPSCTDGCTAPSMPSHLYLRQ